MKFFLLASGSEGNCLYLEDSGQGIIIDVGISRRRIVAGLQEQGINPRTIKAVLLTHEHFDHVKGLEVFYQYFELPVYASEGTIERLTNRIPHIDWHPIYVDFQIGDFNIHPVPLPHDAFEPLGFVVESENSRLLVATDLGFVTDKVLEEMAQCKAVIFESNHDVEMLQNGPYSPELKERILSRWGHLSNNQCAAALKKACWSGLKLVVLAHLSKENNMPSLALAESVKVLPKETKVLTASRINYTGPFRI